MRGFAVIVMVVGHSIDAVLSPASRTTELFRIYDIMRGFTAPMFLFVSGFAFTVVVMRRWHDHVRFGAPARKRFAKMLLLLALGYALHFPFFSLNKLLYHMRPQDYAQMFQVDILHCLAVSIMALQLLVVLTRTPQRFAVVAGSVATLLVIAAPLVWGRDLSGVVTPFLAPYVNQSVPSIFPLFPFAAYLFTGAAAGALYALARQQGEEHLLLRKLLLGGIAAGLAGLVLELIPVTLYPPHDFWKTNPVMFLFRIGIVAAVTAGFFHIRRLPALLARNLVVLGQASLVVYALHLILVYGSVVNLGLYQLIGQQLGTAGAVAVAAGVLVLMTTTVHVRNILREHHLQHLQVFQAGVTSTLLYFFLTKPW